MEEDVKARHDRMVAIYTGDTRWLPRFLDIYKAMMFYYRDKNARTAHYGRYYNEFYPLLKTIDVEIEGIVKELNNGS